MVTNDTTTEILNDLIAMNNDRIEGYEHALKELEDSDQYLHEVFLSLIQQSHDFKMALGNEVQVNGESIETGTTFSGKIYRAWMDVKAAFASRNEKSVLESCEFGEDAILKAYDSALEEVDLPRFIQVMLSEQRDDLQTAHDTIKSLRNNIS